MKKVRIILIVQILVVLAFNLSCNRFFIQVDDSAKDVVVFQIDSTKLKLALQMVDSVEKQNDLSNLPLKPVLPNVDIKAICNDLRMMLTHPNSTIIGNSGHYCGIAVVLNWMLNNQPEKYAKAVLELACSGETIIGSTNSKMKIPKALIKRVDYTETGKSRTGFIYKDIDSTSISDFILGVSLVYSEKFIQKAGLIDRRATFRKKSWGSFLFGNTMPWEMDDYFRKIGVNLSNKGFYLTDKENIEELYKIEKATKEGKMPVIFDNHYISYSRTKNLLYRFVGAHFITIHSFNVNREKQVVNYTYWDYGKVKNNPFLTRTVRPLRTGNMKKDIRNNKMFKAKGLDIQKREISTTEFLKAMKGYWIPEK